MKNELTIKKCKSCGATIKIIEDCNCNECGIICCGEQMDVLKPNSVDAAIEKHVPNYEKIENEILVTVNHVMEEDHFIEWISLISDNKEYLVKLYPNQNAECRFPYIPGACLYAYCNKHGLWKKDIK